MAISQKRAKRKITGGRYKKLIKKLKNLGGLPTYTKIGKRKTQTIRARSSTRKIKLLQEQTANIYDKKTKKYKKVKIQTIIENPANRHFIRRNILTKGCIIKTELGNARVTSRPGQEGTINAILI